jgi:hypothetical protein
MRDDGFQHHVGGRPEEEEEEEVSLQCTIVTSAHATTPSRPTREESQNMEALSIMIRRDAPLKIYQKPRPRHALNNK